MVALREPGDFELQEVGRPWQLPDGAPSGLEAHDYYLGQGQNALEVAVALASSPPSRTDMRTLWGRRHAGRPSPVLCVVLYRRSGTWRAAVCGPTGEDPAAVLDLDLGHVRRICEAALAEPDRHAATRFLMEALPESSEDLPGLRNVGMFATHHLRSGVPTRADWEEECEKGRQLLDRSGRDLVEGLGFEVEERGPTTSVLRAEGTARVVAVFLDEAESPEGTYQRFGGTSPATHGLAAADRDGLPYVLLTRGHQVRIYATSKEAGVGRKGRAETFVEANLALLPDAAAGYLPLIFGAAALSSGGSFEEVLDRSRDFAAGLGARLRDRVYGDVVPGLARAVVAGEEGADEADLDFLYEQTLVVLFRLLFVAYAEDRDLLPYRASSSYQHHALKTLARHLADRWNEGPLEFDEHATDLWSEAQQLFAAVNFGNAEWQVPPYNGGLFSDDAEVSLIGHAIDQLRLTNAEFGPPLAALLVDRGDDGIYGPVDFRSLSVREFGTIYEGLLESSLATAPEDLTVGPDGSYLPAEEGEEIAVAASEVYLHNRSGARKATGSYFTKPFAVEHLLAIALEPALDDHLERVQALLDVGDQARAAEVFFDFRCADIAMGSGHFLVSAVDHIEARLSTLLAEQPIPEVTAELERLRLRAIENLGELAAGVEIEQSSLLRRQVARRCIYGVDRNPIAVELARLALWIHTFVPGLPLGFLDRTLACGDSLTGIGTIDEAAGILEGDSEAGEASLFREPMLELLGRAENALARLARASDADAREIAEAREAAAEAAEVVAPVRDLLDLLLAVRSGRATRLEEMSESAVAAHPDLDGARDLARNLDALHFPVAFPEVFRAERAGFDCVVGNPPWDKVRFEPSQFWVTRSPGLQGLSESDRRDAIAQLRTTRPTDARLEEAEKDEREQQQIFFREAYRFQGTGHLDYAKLFVERAIALTSSGYLAYVLPRQCLVLGGWSALRELMLAGSRLLVTQARNRGGWLFDDVHHSYMVVLLVRMPDGSSSRSASVWPVAESEVDIASPRSPLILESNDIDQISGSAVLPWLDHPASGDLFSTLARRPRLSGSDGWIQGRVDTRWDFSGSGRHARFRTDESSEGAWKVLMARHVLGFRLDSERGFRRFIPEPMELVPLDLGVAAGGGGTPQLDASHPAITFRFPARNDDARTVIAAPLPAQGFLYSAGYEHGIRTSADTSAHEILALLGYLNSFCCDWWARRVVDRHVTAPVLNNIPVPDWSLEEVSEVASCCAALVARDGELVLPGGRIVSPPDELAGQSVTSLRSKIEALVMRGLGVVPKNVVHPAPP